MNYDLIFMGFALAASIIMNILLLGTHAKLKELVQSGLDAAAKNRYSRVPLRIQDVLDLGLRPRGTEIWDDGEFRHPKEFLRKPGGFHPARKR
ncbi:hypothetical protein DRO27_03825 [Candidatus Bathyarchaeota archaeon]|nr:MAG: hypothetical protein DRO27_03825 [Candidatus Bathyarchaeota archaeon]